MQVYFLRPRMMCSWSALAQSMAASFVPTVLRLKIVKEHRIKDLVSFAKITTRLNPTKVVMSVFSAALSFVPRTEEGACLVSMSISTALTLKSNATEQEKEIVG